MTVFGVDLSDFDRGRGPVDVAAMARGGIVFLSHKATEGTSIRHVYYGQTLNAARAAGIPLLGAYFVPRTPGNGGAGTIPQQVAYFLAYLDAQTPWWRSMPEFFIQVDTEHWSNDNGLYDAVSPQHGAQACTLLRQQTGKWVIHYAPQWAYLHTIPGDEPLWASAYGDNPALPYRQAWVAILAFYARKGWGTWPAPYSGRKPTIWQFGSRATVGTQPGCDINAFDGTLDQLRALITGGNDMGVLEGDQARQLAGIAEQVSGVHWTTTQIPINGVRKPLHVAWPELLATVSGFQATGAANATAIAGLQATVSELLRMVQGADGDVSEAALIARIDAASGEMRALVETTHREEMSALTAAHDAEVAGLQAELAARQPAAADTPAQG